ncbi:hypothetical protein GCM10007981_02130 [Thermocladium modestius]|uniref:Uncharacterized protein n=1 Tax=Thermocladium modestius TaxID=62609 RepID=A0A830GVQ6_9CREN|nr:hypothetical protein [Thermocladium modestius]GGP19241.1 hypothetical protein GCM10007981_02130 [Thermocladium modestius]
MIVTAKKFIPIETKLQEVRQPVMEAGKLIDRIGEVIDSLINDVEKKGNVINLGISVSPLSIGSIDGLLVVVWAMLQ